jgi:hypothetical protein
MKIYYSLGPLIIVSNMVYLDTKKVSRFIMLEISINGRR